MITKVTKGVKISVQVAYEATVLRHSENHYAFTYHITIDNQTEDTIQLLSRYWKIKDALEPIKIVKGDGVIGLKPILKPQETHNYTSGCLLLSPIGSMSGYYTMVNYKTGKLFKVEIPVFKLDVPFILN